MYTNTHTVPLTTSHTDTHFFKRKVHPIENILSEFTQPHVLFERKSLEVSDDRMFIFG